MSGCPIQLNWHRIDLRLRCTNDGARKAHSFSVLEAIVKGIHEHSGVSEAGVPVLFRVPGLRIHQIRLSARHNVAIEVLLFTDHADLAERWLEVARCYFDPGQPGRNFKVVGLGQLQPENAGEWFGTDAAETVSNPGSAVEASDEICLDFLTPLPFQTTPGYPRTWLDASGLRALMDARLRRLVPGYSGHLAELPQLRPIPAYWHYEEIKHASRQSGHKYLNGCVGPLLVRSEALERWQPWLRLFERIGLGAQVTFAQGQFRLRPRSAPILDARLLDPNQLAQTIEIQSKRHENLLAELATGPNPVNRDQFARELSSELRSGWCPSPLYATPLKRQGESGRARVLEIPAPRDRVVFSHLRYLLAEPFDRLFASYSIGYRRGHSRGDAIGRIREAIADGCTHVLESDIADFFPSVNLELLWRKLDAVLPRKDRHVRKALAIALRVKRTMAGTVHPRDRGLPLGTALSPLLANLYLDTFDRELERVLPGIHLVRYADDFVVLTRSEATAYALLDHAGAAAANLGLALNVEKTHVRRIAEGFDFLGIRFSAEAGSEQAHDERPDNLRKLLYITEPFAFVGLRQGSVTVRGGDAHLGSFPLNRTGGIVTLVPCSLSTQLIARIADLGVPLTIAGNSGRQIATVAGDTASRFARAALQERRHAELGESGIRSIALEIVDAKLENYIALVRQRGVKGTAALVARLMEGRAELKTKTTLEAIRGVEGESARQCFPFIAGWIQAAGFPWQGRKRHGQHPDRLNSMLNLGYHLLYTRINALLRVAGLNPYLGFLHVPTSRFEALTCDLQEPFRPYIDRLVVRLINLRVIEAGDFEESNEGYWLKRPARARFLQQYARELDRRALKGVPSLSMTLEAQVRSLVSWVQEEKPIEFHRWRGRDG